MGPSRPCTKENKLYQWKLNGAIADNDKRTLSFKFGNPVLSFWVMLCAFADQGDGLFESRFLFLFLIPMPENDGLGSWNPL